MPLTPQDFVSKWKPVTAREKPTYQEHCIDLCHLVGYQTPNDYDPKVHASVSKRGQTAYHILNLVYEAYELQNRMHSLKHHNHNGRGNQMAQSGYTLIKWGD